MIYIFLAEGFEECEAIAPLDILRRAQIPVQTVGIGSKTVVGSHSVGICCDITENEVDFNNITGIILPGGMPGTTNLEKCQTVQRAIDVAHQKGLLIAAICAAPLILGHKNILKGKNAVCFTGFEKELHGAEVLATPVCADDNVITAYGAGAAFDFGFKIVSYLKGDAFSQSLSKQMRYQEVK